MATRARFRCAEKRSGAIGGSRGAAAGALRLTTTSTTARRTASTCWPTVARKPILIVSGDHEPTARKARHVGIGVAATIGECLEILDQASVARGDAGVFQMLASAVGWK